MCTRIPGLFPWLACAIRAWFVGGASGSSDAQHGCTQYRYARLTSSPSFRLSYQQKILALTMN